VLGVSAAHLALGQPAAAVMGDDAPLAVVDGLSAWVSRQGCRSVAELVGAAKA